MRHGSAFVTQSPAHSMWKWLRDAFTIECYSKKEASFFRLNSYVLLATVVFIFSGKISPFWHEPLLMAKEIYTKRFEPSDYETKYLLKLKIALVPEIMRRVGSDAEWIMFSGTRDNNPTAEFDCSSTSFTFNTTMQHNVLFVKNSLGTFDVYPEGDMLSTEEFSTAWAAMSDALTQFHTACSIPKPKTLGI